MYTWKELLSSLDTPGGHILVLLGVLAMLWAATASGLQSGEKFAGEAFGALLYSLKGPSAK